MAENNGGNIMFDIIVIILVISGLYYGSDQVNEMNILQNSIKNQLDGIEKRISFIELNLEQLTPQIQTVMRSDTLSTATPVKTKIDTIF